jgi:hypothetical protein
LFKTPDPISAIQSIETKSTFTSHYSSSHKLDAAGRAQEGTFSANSVETGGGKIKAWDSDSRPPNPENPDDIDYQGSTNIGEFTYEWSSRLNVTESGTYHDDAQGLRHRYELLGGEIYPRVASLLCLIS